MKTKHKGWWLFVLSGVCLAAETSDAEILKDLDFFQSFDLLQNDAAMDENVGEILDGPEEDPVPSVQPKEGVR